MGRIKELRAKVKAEEATEDEKEELKELEGEAKEEEEEATEDEKSLENVANKLLSIMEAKQEKKAKIIEEKKMEKNSGFEAEYKAMDDDHKIVSFLKALRDDDKPKLQAIHNITVPEMAKLKVMEAGTSALGGYLVPTILYQRIVEEQKDAPVIANKANIINNCPAHLDIDQLVGRPKMSWTAEKAIKDTSTATFNQIDLTPYSVTCIVAITNKLEEDAEVVAPISQYVTGLIATSMQEELERVFAVGAGTTQPSGIDSYAATVHRIVATPANILTPDSLIDVTSRLNQKYLANAVWLMNSQAWRVAMQLKDSQNRYLFIADPVGKTPGTLLGYPILRCDALPNGHIWFGDLKSYWIGYRGGINVAKSTDATLEGIGNLFERNMFAIRVERRVDAELADLDGMVYLSGAN